MEVVQLNSSSNRSISSSTQFTNGNKRNNQILNSSNFHGGGILHAPPLSLSYSYPPSLSVFHPPLQNHNQPPLLPLPIPKPNTNPRNRGISCPPVTRKINNKPKSKPAKKADAAAKQVLRTSSASLAVIPSGNPVGPDPNNLPKDVYGVFALSPPPSSLPLPTFSLRPKLSCNAEAAAGIDAGATDNLRRLLRLR
ncbi:hypothetical protein Vadar_009006 [Vaccinium darrowii]|uniref:Uncharacterized protein n=1 Tax=Vaccinium darrowii TaxID=229202 RepID=A0ACB7Y752_9ERIC|nr:hypothetical protein Vadar_009006 [Vaccinium darrowii]